jgi:hypothetical protein
LVAGEAAKVAGELKDSNLARRLAAQQVSKAERHQSQRLDARRNSNAFAAAVMLCVWPMLVPQALASRCVQIGAMVMVGALLALSVAHGALATMWLECGAQGRESGSKLHRAAGWLGWGALRSMGLDGMLAAWTGLACLLRHAGWCSAACC